MDYNISDLDENGILKPGPFLLLTTLILSRQVFYGPLSLLAQRKGRGSSGAEIDVSWLSITSYWEFVACIPAIIVFFLLFKREAGAAPWIQSAWARGRLLLLAGAIMQFGVLLLVAWDSNFSLNTPILVLLILHAYLLVYLWRDQRVKDVFSMFPSKLGTE